MNIDTIWKTYQASLRGFLVSKISIQEDADDLLQEILIKTYQNLPSLQSEKKLKAWLFQIAKRTIIDFYRQKATEQIPQANELWYEDNEKNQHELAKCITPFIQSLPDKDRDLLLAIEIYGQSQKEYAEQYGIPYSTLKSRVLKSRQALKALFQQCCQIQREHQDTASDCCNMNNEKY